MICPPTGREPSPATNSALFSWLKAGSFNYSRRDSIEMIYYTNALYFRRVCIWKPIPEKPMPIG